MSTKTKKASIGDASIFIDSNGTHDGVSAQRTPNYT